MNRVIVITIRAQNLNFKLNVVFGGTVFIDLECGHLGIMCGITYPLNVSKGLGGIHAYTSGENFIRSFEEMARYSVDIALRFSPQCFSCCGHFGENLKLGKTVQKKTIGD